jgi:hypothetical protein
VKLQATIAKALDALTLAELATWPSSRPQPALAR